MDTDKHGLKPQNTRNAQKIFYRANGIFRMALRWMNFSLQSLVLTFYYRQRHKPACEQPHTIQFHFVLVKTALTASRYAMP